jgi:hypothetical protein
MARVIRCAIPEVMMGVDDRQGWVEGGFLRLPCQPGFIRRLNARIAALDGMPS